MGRLIHRIKVAILFPFMLIAFACGLMQALWIMHWEKRKPRVERAEAFAEDDAEVIEIRGERVFFRSRRPIEIKESIVRGYSAHAARVMTPAIPMSGWKRK